MIVTAESFILDLLQSIASGRVTVATLNVLTPHASQLMQLAEIFKENDGKDIKESKRPSYKESYFRRLEELKLFGEQKEQLHYFISCCESFPSGKLFVSSVNHTENDGL